MIYVDDSRMCEIIKFARTMEQEKLKAQYQLLEYAQFFH